MRAAALFLLGLAASVAQAGWQITNSQRAPSPNESVASWTTALKETETGGRATLHLAVFDTKAATLRVIDQPIAPRRGLAEMMAGTEALAGVNGGYFDPEDAPIGLLVSAGRVLSPLRKAKLLSGVLFATKNRVDIVRATRFSMNEKVKSALQCGPFLVERAAPVPGLNESRPARRTFAAVDGHGHAALGVSSPVSLAQLGKILALAHLGGSMKFVRALNLDGGSSTAFWFAGKDEAFSIGELKSVRDFVAVVPR